MYKHTKRFQNQIADDDVQDRYPPDISVIQLLEELEFDVDAVTRWGRATSRRRYGPRLLVPRFGRFARHSSAPQRILF